MSKKMNVSLTHAAPPSPQAGARRALIGVPPYRLFWPPLRLPGPPFAFPGLSFAFQGRRFVFPGLRFAFPGLRFAFPGRSFAFLAKRRGIAQGPSPAGGPPRPSCGIMILTTLISSAQCVHRVCEYSAMHQFDLHQIFPLNMTHYLAKMSDIFAKMTYSR